MATVGRQSSARCLAGVRKALEVAETKSELEGRKERVLAQHESASSSSIEMTITWHE